MKRKGITAVPVGALPVLAKLPERPVTMENEINMMVPYLPVSGYCWILVCVLTDRSKEQSSPASPVNHDGSSGGAYQIPDLDAS